MNPCASPTEYKDTDGDGRWISIVWHLSILARLIFANCCSDLLSYTVSNTILPFLQHNRFLSECREKDPDVIFIGDCILEHLQHTEAWNLYFAPLHCLNFSIYQDQTQNILWRVQNGELDNVKPKVKYEHPRL